MAASGNSPFIDLGVSVVPSVVECVVECIARHTVASQHLLVGFSGGLDSTVLLHAVQRAALSQSLSLGAVHVHHGLSPHADAWGEHCQSVCTALDVPLQILRVQVPEASGEGIEGAARRVRRDALSTQPHDWCLLAHHRDDQAETLLHNLFRGAGVRGLAAMRECHGKTLRPLLTLPRAALLHYAQEHALQWIEDESNQDLRYTRNNLRHRVLPVIRERFEKVDAQLAATAGRLAETLGLLEELAVIDLAGNPPNFPLPLTLFKQLTTARAINLLRAMLAWQQMQSPDDVRLREFVRQLRTARPDRHPRLVLGVCVLESRGGMLNLCINQGSPAHQAP